jgi:uncharacterized membrane protein HdeD (DUF308 family)
MTATRTTTVRSPSWIRILQLGIGAIAIGLSISAMIYPFTAAVATFVAAAIVLFLFGVEHLVTGLFLYMESRFTHIGLGALIMILSGLGLVYPLHSATLVIWLAGFALLFGGIGSILSGVLRRRRRVYYGANRREVVYVAGGRSRVLSIAAGALAVALSISIIVFPNFGVALAGVLVGIALLFYGIKLVVTGIHGRGQAVTSTSTDAAAA